MEELIALLVQGIASLVEKRRAKNQAAQKAQQAGRPRASALPPPLPGRPGLARQQALRADQLRNLASPNRPPPTPGAGWTMPSQKPVAQRQMWQQMSPQRTAPRKAGRRVPTAPIRMVQTAPPLPTAAPAAVPQATAAARKPATAHHEIAQGVSAAAISRWLKPATLRQQFILTEIFQPPVTLRPEREW